MVLKKDRLGLIHLDKRYTEQAIMGVNNSPAAIQTSSLVCVNVCHGRKWPAFNYFSISGQVIVL